MTDCGVSEVGAKLSYIKYLDDKGLEYIGQYNACFMLLYT
jgi:hypothetical protein